MADAGEGVMLTAGGMSIVADKGWVNVSVMGGTHGGALGIGSRVAVVSVAEAAAGTEPGSMAGGVLTDLGMVTLEVVTLTEVEAKGGTEEIEAAVDAAWGNGVVAWGVNGAGGGERGNVGVVLGLLDANSWLAGLATCSMNKAKLLLEVPAAVDRPR